MQAIETRPAERAADAAAARVAFVSTYAPQRCGIAAYTGHLARALAAAAPGAAPIVLSEWGGSDGVDAGVRSIPTFRRDDDFTAAIVRGACEAQADVVHVQHAPDIFGTDDRLVRLCRELAARRIPTVVTLHTVLALGTGTMRGHFNVPAFHRRLGRTAAALVVHGEVRAAETLRAHGVRPDLVHVIPHGTPAAAPLDRAAARAHLGLPPDAPVLLCIGFLRGGKRFGTPIRALRRVRRRFPHCRLIVAGAVQANSWTERWYPGYLRGLARAFGVADAIELRQTFLPDRDVALLHAAADLVLLPYRQPYGSASGALHTALGAGRLVVCSDIPKFAEVAEHLSAELIVRTSDAPAWARAIERGLERSRDAAFLARLAAYADATAWPRIAARHQALYRQLT